jgi:DnaJ-class molecular chaperone
MNHYDTLGLLDTAKGDEIKKAYHKLVALWHPDKCKNKSPEQQKFAQQKLSDINKAYEILGNPIKRQQYDIQTELEAQAKSEFQYNNDDNDTISSESDESTISSESSPIDIEQFREQLKQLHASLGKGDKIESDNESEEDPYLSKYHTKGSDIEVNLEITLEDIYNEVTKQVKIKRKIGPDQFKDVLINVPIRVRSDDTDVTIIRGTGNWITADGRFARTPGDTTVYIKIKKHPLYKRRGENLLATLEVTLDEAMNGFTRTIKCINGDKFELKLDDIPRTDMIHIIKEKGMKKDYGSYGDIIFSFVVLIIDKPHVINKISKDEIMPTEKPKRQYKKKDNETELTEKPKRQYKKKELNKI